MDQNDPSPTTGHRPRGYTIGDFYVPVDIPGYSRLEIQRIMLCWWKIREAGARGLTARDMTRAGGPFRHFPGKKLRAMLAMGVECKMLWHGTLPAAGHRGGHPRVVWTTQDHRPADSLTQAERDQVKAQVLATIRRAGPDGITEAELEAAGAFSLAG